jgi:glycosyltransferase involved in cell wall biosynthesis
LIAKRYGVAHFWCVRERLDSYKLKYSLGKLISKFFFKHGADRYFMISKHLIEYYKETIPPKLMTLVYNGVSFAENSYKIDKVKGDSFNICSIGLLSEQKNQLEVLKSVQILINKGVAGFKVYFVGVANSLYYTELISFVNAHNLQSFVEFVGHQNNIDDILQNMDLGLATSVGEAFGRSTIECMLHGIPVVASNSGANLELVVDNFNGSIYQLNNPNDLADKIEMFIKDSNYLRKMGSNAHKYAKEHFSAELNAANVYKIFLSSINEDLDATN